MKLSDFLKNKKVKFNDNGEIEVINNKIVGEFEFYSLTPQRIFEIKEKVIDKVKKDMTEEQFVFELFPYLCSIERDLDAKEFDELLTNPTIQFMTVYTLLTDAMNELVKMISDINKLTEKVDDMKDNTDKLKEEVNKREAKEQEFKKEVIDVEEIKPVEKVEVVETVEEKINKIIGKLAETTDKDERKKLLDELAELNNQLESK